VTYDRPRIKTRERRIDGKNHHTGSAESSGLAPSDNSQRSYHAVKYNTLPSNARKRPIDTSSQSTFRSCINDQSTYRNSSKCYSPSFCRERSQLRISNQVPIPELMIGEYLPPSMKPIIATSINSAPATALGRTLLRIVFNDISDHFSRE
jgi:hypothetical protein